MIAIFLTIYFFHSFRLAELEEQIVTNNGQRPVWMRLLRKSAMPIQVLLVVAFGLAYLLNPGGEGGVNFGLVFSPQLRYVRGPPPM